MKNLLVKTSAIEIQNIVFPSKQNASLFHKLERALDCRNWSVGYSNLSLQTMIQTIFEDPNPKRITGSLMPRPYQQRNNVRCHRLTRYHNHASPHNRSNRGNHSKLTPRLPSRDSHTTREKISSKIPPIVVVQLPRIFRATPLIISNSVTKVFLILKSRS